MNLRRRGLSITVLLIIVLFAFGVQNTFAANNENPWDWERISQDGDTPTIYETEYQFGTANALTVYYPTGTVYYFGSAYQPSDGERPIIQKYATESKTWTSVHGYGDDTFSNDARKITAAIKVPETDIVIFAVTGDDGAELWRLDMSNDTFTKDTRYTQDSDLENMYDIDISSNGKECILLQTNTTTPIVTCADDDESNFSELDMTGPESFASNYPGYQTPQITFLGEDPIIATYESGEGTFYPSVWRYFTDDSEWFQITYNDFNVGERVRGLATVNGQLHVLMNNESSQTSAYVKKYDEEEDEWTLVGGNNFGEDETYTSQIAMYSSYDDLFVTALNSDGLARTFYWVNSESEWERINIPGFDGDPEETFDLITAVIYYNNGAHAIATSQNGEGWYQGRAYLQDLFPDDEETTTTTTSTTVVNDSDLDGVNSSTEIQAPNSGDGNNDSVADKDQSNVSSLPGANGKYITIVSPTGTQLSNVSVSPESAEPAQDNTYNYGQGLVHFTVSGVAPGSTITMQIFFESSDAANNFVARKLTGSNYATLDGASLQNVAVGNSNAVKLTYSLSDNGPLDTNTVLGTITDPVGIGSVGALPATGSNLVARVVTFAFVSISIGLMAFFIARKRKSQRLDLIK